MFLVQAVIKKITQFIQIISLLNLNLQTCKHFDMSDFTLANGENSFNDTTILRFRGK